MQLIRHGEALGAHLRKHGLRLRSLILFGLIAAGQAAQAANGPSATTCQQGHTATPEAQWAYKKGKTPAVGRSFMVVAGNPLATQVGCEVLRSGGAAVDAAVAVQMVLGLVEPEASGIGGGAFLLHYNAKTQEVQTYDGRETAPAAATEDYLRYADAATKSLIQPALSPNVGAFANTRASGRSIGTPGLMRMLELAHRDHGRTPWSELLQPAIRIATEGFAISGRMAAAIAASVNDLKRDPDAAAYFLNADGSPRALGSTIQNPDYAATLAAVARGGADAFYTGPIAQSIVDKIRVRQGGPLNPVAITPGLTELSDLSSYRAVRRAPVCTTYREWWVCGMGPPSSGGIAVAQILGILENFDLPSMRPPIIHEEGGKPSVLAAHLVSEAQRLAYADRNQYVADADFVSLPAKGVASMVDKAYLQARASLISPTKSMGTATAGVFPGAVAAGSSAQEGRGTTHVSIVDGDGNVVSLTSSIEARMGSFHFTQGFLLNNELTDFSSEPADAVGPIANRIQGGKRPRSSMSPTLVFRKAADGTRGAFVMVTGAPGGASIIQFVTKTLVAALDWGLDAQQATSFVNFGAANSPTTGIGGEHPSVDAAHQGANDPLVMGLRSLGHTVSVAAQSSGVATIIRATTPGTASSILVGGADPRREGTALGDTPH